MGDDETAAHDTTSASDATGSQGESGDDGASTKGPADGLDLKGIVRQLTAPMIESLDTRLRDQIEAHVDELLTEKLDAALADRFLTVDRAIADLSRSIASLERELGAHEEDDGSN